MVSVFSLTILFFATLRGKIEFTEMKRRNYNIRVLYIEQGKGDDTFEEVDNVRLSTPIIYILNVRIMSM